MKDFKTIDHGTDKMDMRGLGYAVQVRPTELHHKSDGAKDDSPSFAIVMQGRNMAPVVGQISLKMLNEAMEELGYSIIHKRL